MKVYSERPGHLQLFHYPLGVFVAVPPTQPVQQFKQALCNALHQAGVEIPLPTSHPINNWYNGGTLARRTIKASTPQIQQALSAVGVGVVWLAQYGGKVPFKLWAQDFQDVLNLPMKFPMAFDLGAHFTTVGSASCICLAGIPGGRTDLCLQGKTYKAYTHVVLPGLSGTDDSVVWGTLEVRAEGHSGSEKGKFIQGYSPLSHVVKAAGEYEVTRPTTMKALRSRKKGLLNLADTICSNLEKAAGFRVEARALSGTGNLEDSLVASQAVLQELCLLLHDGKQLQLKLIPLPVYHAFLKEEVKSAVELDTFRGMRDCGPSTPEQEVAFSLKALQWALLLSNCGVASGHFGRLVEQGMSCQVLAQQPNTEAQQPDTDPAAEEHEQADSSQTLALPPAARATPSPHPGPSDAKEAPKAATVSMGEPLTLEEQEVLEGVAFLGRKSRTGALHCAFTYKEGWGGKSQGSAWYPSKECASRAIWEWAGPDWTDRVKTVQHKALPTKQVAPKAEHINTSAPLTAAEEQLVATVDFQRKKTKKKEEWWTFTYKSPWGPAHNKMRRSSWYPSKAAAARPISEWAGADWPHRVKCKPLTVLAAANEQEQVKEEHRISMQIRQLRQEYVRWLTQELKGKDAVNTAAIVEDDSLCSLLLACFQHGEGQEDALQQALKVETDLWSGPICGVGPKGLRGVMTGRGVFFETHRLEELEEATTTCFLVNHNKHWVPFWRKKKLCRPPYSQALDHVRLNQGVCSPILSLG